MGAIKQMFDDNKFIKGKIPGHVVTLNVDDFERLTREARYILFNNWDNQYPDRVFKSKVLDWLHGAGPWRSTFAQTDRGESKIAFARETSAIAFKLTFL